MILAGTRRQHTGVEAGRGLDGVAGGAATSDGAETVDGGVVGAGGCAATDALTREKART